MPRWHLLMCRYVAILLMMLSILAAFIEPKPPMSDLIIAMVVGPVIVWATYFIKPRR